MNIGTLSVEINIQVPPTSLTDLETDWLAAGVDQIAQAITKAYDYESSRVIRWQAERLMRHAGNSYVNSIPEPVLRDFASQLVFQITSRSMDELLRSVEQMCLIGLA